MIKLTYKDLNSESLNKALAEITLAQGYSDIKASYNVAKITRNFSSGLRKAREEYAEWSKDFLVRDEAGNFKLAANPSPIMPYEITAGREEEFAKQLEEFMGTGVEIEAHPIKVSDVAGLKLSPHQLITLEGLFEAQALDGPSI